MSEEKINNSNSWKSKLDHPDFFVGNIFQNKNKVWENLYNQLEGASIKKTIDWLKVAAVILFFLVPGVIGFHKINFSSIHKPLGSLPTTRLYLANHTNISVDRNNLSVKRNGLNVNEIRKPGNVLVSIIKDTNKLNKYDLPALKNILVKELSVAPDTSAKILTLHLPEKEKLKVIANNEIDNQPEEIGSIVIKNKLHFFYLKSNATDRTPIMTNNSGRAYIKINLPPQN